MAMENQIVSHVNTVWHFTPVLGGKKARAGKAGSYKSKRLQGGSNASCILDLLRNYH